MGFLPDMTDDSQVFIEGLARANAGTVTKVRRKQPSKRLADLIQPPELRSLPDTREYTLLNEDEDLVQWERLVRSFLYSLASTREHRVTPQMIWNYATNNAEHDPMDPDYRRDLRKIRKVMRHYFGKSYQTTIRGVKAKEAWLVRRGFLVYRKAPATMTIYLEWKQGLKTH